MTAREKQIYKLCVAWVAQNDEIASEGALNPDEVMFQTSVMMISDIFGLNTREVAVAVVNLRCSIPAEEMAEAIEVLR